jgi:DNA mismatch repair protein MutL
MAKRSAGRFGMSRLSNQEMNTLVEQLFASSNPSYSPSGELTMKILGLAEIANIFQK